jgi:hypothetical protein
MEADRKLGCWALLVIQPRDGGLDQDMQAGGCFVC